MFGELTLQIGDICMAGVQLPVLRAGSRRQHGATLHELLYPTLKLPNRPPLRHTATCVLRSGDNIVK